LTNEKNNLEKIEESYKSQLENKEKDIIQLQTKIAILNKNIKNSFKKIYVNSSLQEKSSNINYNQDESGYTKNNINNEDSTLMNQTRLSKNQDIIKNLKNKRCFYNQSNFNNLNENLALYYKYLDENKTISKKPFDKNNSASNIYLHNSISSSNLSGKNYIYKYDNKNFKQNDNSIPNLLKNANLTRENSYNNLNFQNKGYNVSSKSNLSYNITNNTFNMNKNNVMINLNTSIKGDNLNIEKMKVQQRLAEYRKLIDLKIDSLMKDKKRKFFNIRKANNSCKVEKKSYSPNENKIYKKKTLKYTSSSDYGKGRNSNKRNYNNFSNTNYKNISNENIKNFQDINNIIPKRIVDCDRKAINSKVNKKKYSKKKKIFKEKGRIYLDSYNEVMKKF
jgi:hypothetical protein